jgi:hypothetical protein
VVTVTGEAGDSNSVTFTNGVHTVTKTVTGTGSAQPVTLTSGDLTTLTDGTISVSATQTDAAGNAQTAAAATTSFVLDTTAPAAPTLALGTGVANGATAAEATAAGGVVTVTGEAGDSISVTFTNGVHTVTKTVTGTGSAQAVTLTSGDLTTLTDGTISVSATQTDAAGNVQAAAAATTGFVLDTTAPAETLAITSIAGGSLPNDTTLTVSGSNGALGAGEKIQVSSDGGTTWTDVVQNTATSWSFVDGTTRTANFTYQARVVDTAGNVGTTASQAVIVANNGGTLSIGGSPAFTVEFTGTGGNLVLGSSPGFTGTVNAVSTADGAVAITGSGNVTTSISDAIDLTASGGTQGNSSNLSVGLGGAITGAANGIFVVQNAFGNIAIATSGPVIGQSGRGIFAEESATGTGSILVNGSGNVTGTGTAYSGIVAEILNATNGSDVTVNQTGNIRGGYDGIHALTDGNGNVTVLTGPNALISGGQNNGIEAASSGTGSIFVTTAANDTITSASSGINAYNQATSIPLAAASTVIVNAYGTIDSGALLTGLGNQPAGILAGYEGGATDTKNPNVFGSVTISNYANIMATAGDGIRGYNYGVGNITITDEANTTIIAPGEYGIREVNYGSGNESITTSSGDSIASGASGISAANDATAIASSADSSISVVAHGAINSGTNLNASARSRSITLLISLPRPVRASMPTIMATARST